MWERDIGVEISSKDATINRFSKLINKSVDIMQNKANNEFNPRGYSLPN